MPKQTTDESGHGGKRSNAGRKAKENADKESLRVTVSGTLTREEGVNLEGHWPKFAASRSAWVRAAIVEKMERERGQGAE